MFFYFQITESSQSSRLPAFGGTAAVVAALAATESALAAAGFVLDSARSASRSCMSEKTSSKILEEHKKRCSNSTLMVDTLFTFLRVLEDK